LEGSRLMTATNQKPRRAAQSKRKPPVVTLDQWRKAAVHTVWVNQHQQVKIRIPDLAALFVDGRVPEDLRAVAMSVISGDDPMEKTMVEAAAGGEKPQIDAEVLAHYIDLLRFMVSAALVEPEVSYEQIKAGMLPNEDLELLAAVVGRKRDTDARGVILGVEPLERWATFRTEHGCPAGCEACQKVVEQFSTVDVGDL
jgi:hypothetical protein